jgi:hypothetical protein
MHLISWNDNETWQPTEVPSVNQVVSGGGSDAPTMLPEEVEEGELNFEYLMGSDSQELAVADMESERERRYTITDNGIELLRDLLEKSEGRQKNQYELLRDSCTTIRRQFGSLSLKSLLRYVYDHYATYTTKSTILSRVIDVR